MSSKWVKANKYRVVKWAGKFFLLFRGYYVGEDVIMERCERFFLAFGKQMNYNEI